MKKILALILVLATVAMAFVACDDSKKDKSKEKDVSKYEVTAEEWKNAFDFSKFTNYVVSMEELCAETADNEVYGVRGTCNVQNGIPYYDLVQFWNDEETSEKGYGTTVINDPSGFGGEWFPEMWYEIEGEVNYGYSMFTYSENSKAYSGNLEVDGIPCVVEFFFNDAKITKITMSGRDSETSINFTCTISYN